MYQQLTYVFTIPFQGGHFAAVEQSAVLLKDVEEFIAQVWK
jgi:hypothetical protein